MLAWRYVGCERNRIFKCIWSMQERSLSPHLHGPCMAAGGIQQGVLQERCAPLPGVAARSHR